MQSSHIVTIQKKGDKIQKYESKEQSDFHIGPDIVGLDANILIDLVESNEFKQNIRDQVNIGVWEIYTTNVALGEARHILVRKREYTYENATNKLQNMLKEFKVIKINHNKEGNDLGNKWVNIIKNQMHIKKFNTFPNDCRIVANLFKQAKINLFLTEDQDIEKAVNILKVPIRIRIVGEASQIGSFEVKRFFKEQSKERRKASRKSQKRR
jgi:predicted nucleic acid-binding protein